MNYKATAPDGRVIFVDGPEGLSDSEVIKLARKQHPFGMAPTVPPETPGLIKPSVGGYVAEGFKRRAGDIAAGTAAALIPGGWIPRVLAAEAGQEVGDIAATGKATPGYAAASQLLGEGVAKAVAPIFTPAAYRSFAKDRVKALAAKLDEWVPSWRDLPATAKGLYERAHGTGQRVLSQGFESAIRAIKTQLPPEFVIQVPKVLEVAGRLEYTTEPRNALALIDDLPKLREAGGKPYRQALKALADQLPAGLSPELDAARREYKFGAGWIDFAERGRFLHGERYDPAKAQAALDRYGKQTLLGRGMDEIRAIIRGPGDKPIVASPQSEWKRGLPGLAIGEGLGHHFGVPWWISGPAGAAASRTIMPPTTYKNVPLSPAMRSAQRLAPVAVGAGAREAARELNLPEQLPTVPK